MGVSNGNLDGLLDQAPFPLANYGGASVQSFTTAGSLTATVLATAAVVATGAPGPGAAGGTGETFDIVAVNDATNSFTMTFAIGGTVEGQLTLYVLGYADHAILVSENSPQTIAGLLAANDGSIVDADIGVISHTPLAPGTNVTFASDGTSIDPVPCFAAGTRIATGRGEVAVEALTEADLLPVLRGEGVRRVRWIGHRHVDPTRHPRPWDVQPVRVRAHAFGPDRPRHDLRLSPDHAVWMPAAAGSDAAPVLVPVRYLLNGATIVQEDVAAVTYYHVELADAAGRAVHDVIQAEGLAVESFLDTGNRHAFANGGAVVAQHADFARAVWAAAACAPLVVDGAPLNALRARTLALASALGHRMTDRPDLRLLAGGRLLEPRCHGDGYAFALPAGLDRVRLLSRSAVPAEMLPDSPDCRRLGVAVVAMALDGVPVALDAPALGQGWHAPEPGWRWTGGDAELACAGAGTLLVTIRPLLSYWCDGAPAAAARVALKATRPHRRGRAGLAARL